jgi:hypothetical protein
MKCEKVLVAACLLATVSIGISYGAAAEKTNTGLKSQLPAPDTKPAAMDKPVKVFILPGQSNMLGFGRIGPEDKKGTLENLTRKEGSIRISSTTRASGHSGRMSDTYR